MADNKLRVAVIGAGMAGLSAAYSLEKRGIDVVVFEKNSYVGGRVFTNHKGGYHIDTGAQFLASIYTNTIQLIEELGLSDCLIRIPGHGSVIRDGKLVELWYNARIIFTNLISIKSKIKLLNIIGDLVKNWKRLDYRNLSYAYLLDRESISDYSLRKWNKEILEYIVQPILSGVFYWHPEQTSVALLFIMIKAVLGMKLLTLDGGLGTLPNKLAENLTVYLNSQVLKVSKISSEKYSVRTKNNDTDDHETIFDGVICATTAPEVMSLFDFLDPKCADFFSAVEYSSTVASTIAINKSISNKVYGIFFPYKERNYQHIAAATIQSAKDKRQMPDGHDLIGIFSNDQSGKNLLHSPDSDILQTLLREFKELGTPYQVDEVLFSHTHKWEKAVPKYKVGYFEQLLMFEQYQIDSNDKIAFAGDYLGGPFIEGAVTSGISAANNLICKLLQP